MSVERTAAGWAIAPGSAEQLWELVGDPRRFVEWAALTEEVLSADVPLGLGGRYVERNLVVGPFTAVNTFTVVENDAPRRAVHRMEGTRLARDMRFFVLLTPEGTGTRVTVGMRYKPALGPFGTWLERAVLRPRLRAGFQRTADDVAALSRREHGGAQVAPAAADE